MLWYGTSTSSDSVGKGGEDERKDASGCENREATSAVLRIGWIARHENIQLRMSGARGRRTRRVLSKIITTTLSYYNKQKVIKKFDDVRGDNQVV